ncbi:hypothetical protein B0H14DRAFT_1517721 [Mycena olivaceomarginata]|nr:hypothetical protein B0H14DRAFT_1517721 [Mycena olivaceomarginata]
MRDRREQRNFKLSGSGFDSGLVPQSDERSRRNSRVVVAKVLSVSACAADHRSSIIDETINVISQSTRLLTRLESFYPRLELYFRDHFLVPNIPFFLLALALPWSPFLHQRRTQVALCTAIQWASESTLFSPVRFMAHRRLSGHWKLDELPSRTPSSFPALGRCSLSL